MHLNNLNAPVLNVLTLGLVTRLAAVEIYVVVPQIIKTTMKGRSSHHRHSGLTHFKLTLFKNHRFL